jgi:hypothetical protein
MMGAGGDPDRTDRYGVAAFTIYFATSVLFFARGLFGHLSDRYIGVGPDPNQFIWYLSWWPYALGHHLNPFLPRLIWTPSGVNLGWAAAMPLASVAAYPLTATLGAIASYNLLCLLCPALAAWAAFLLCREFATSWWAALIGEVVFGFSAHMAGKTLGNLNDALVFPVPLAGLIAVHWFRERLTSARFVAYLSALLVTLFLFFVENFATFTVVAGIAWLLALRAASGDDRKRVSAMAVPLMAAYAIAVLVISPYVYFMLSDRPRQAEIMPTGRFAVDLANLLIPTPLTAFGTMPFCGPLAARFTAGMMESGGYLGVALIATTIWFARRHGRDPWPRFLLILLLVVGVFALGPRLMLGGRQTGLALPWLLFVKLPLIEKALPARFMMYATLLIAVLTALSLDYRPRRPIVPALIAAAIVFTTAPNLSARFWTTDADIPSFFSAGLYRQYLASGENVVIMPYGISGDAMLWQAAAKFHFNMVEGWTGFPSLPKAFEDWPIVPALLSSDDLPDAALQLKAFLAYYNIGAIIIGGDQPNGWEYRVPERRPPGWERSRVSARDRALWQRWFAALGVAPVEVGGVLLYRVPLADLQAYRDANTLALRNAEFAGRLATLINAGARYLAADGRPENLTPLRAAQCGLLPADWISRHYSSPHPEDSIVLDRLLLTRWDNGDIAVGYVGKWDTMQTALREFGAQAHLIRYFNADLPPALIDRPVNDAPMLLVMTFTPATLARLAKLARPLPPATAIVAASGR